MTTSNPSTLAVNTFLQLRSYLQEISIQELHQTVKNNTMFLGTNQL